MNALNIWQNKLRINLFYQITLPQAYQKCCWSSNRSLWFLPISVQSVGSTRRPCCSTQATALYRTPWPHSFISRWLVQPFKAPAAEGSGRMQADQFPQGWDRSSPQGQGSVCSSSTFRQCSFFLLRPKQNIDKRPFT